MAIPASVLDAYTKQYRRLTLLATRSAVNRQAELAFAQIACRLACPEGVTATEVWLLAKVAEGGHWECAAAFV